MIPAWHVKCVATLGIQGTIALKPKRMWTLSTITTTIVLNRINDGTNNRGQATKVIIKVTTKVTLKVIVSIISINHPWENWFLAKLN
jgi:hypothetical protein